MTVLQSMTLVLDLVIRAKALLDFLEQLGFYTTCRGFLHIKGRREN
jgi:hypothetical protein